MTKNYHHSKLHNYLRDSIITLLCKINPKWAISVIFEKVLGYKMDWSDPKDFNQKINWLKIYGDSDTWARLTDKYEVRKYLKEKNLEDILVKLYGVWDRAEDINFDKLPNSFVMKTTNGCNTVILLEDKSKINTEEVRKKFKKWMKLTMGYATVEPHYLKIRPRIIAEELLVNDNPQSTSLVDYKFICLNDNIPSMMAYGNDLSYGDIFLYPLQTYYNKKDVVIGISGSGNSENVVRAISWAKENEATTIGLTGYSGGKVKELCQYNVHVPVDDMQIAEDLHMVLDHCMMKILSEKEM